MRHCPRNSKPNRMSRRLVLAILLSAAVLASGPAAAATWCGENGVVRFSFTEAEKLTDMLQTGEAENGVTMVDVYAWLTDVDLVALDGEQFLHLGGFELDLSIEGAEAFIIAQEFPTEVLNVGRKNGNIAVGLVPGQRLVDGRALLVKWQVMFQGRPENVRFGLSAAVSMTCSKTEGCLEDAPPMIYVGAETTSKLGSLFGAGYVPAWLNPTTEPDQTPVHAKRSYADVGLYVKR
jgi:hypothetical protein